MLPHLTTSLHRLAAVNDHGLADDEGGGIGAQPKDGCGDLLGPAHPSYRSWASTAWCPSGVSPKTRSIIWVSMMPGKMAFMRMLDVA